MTYLLMLMMMTTPTNPAPDAYGAALDAFVGRCLAELPEVPGLAVTVVHGDQVLGAKAYGMLDLENRIPATAESRFYIASSTKSMTALVALMLRERGELDFKRSLKDWFPEVSFDPSIKADQINLTHLLSHTAGISNHAITMRLAYSGQHDPETLVRLLADTHANPKFPFGTFDYTNFGYNITALIIQRATGKSWKMQMEALLLKPLGMHQTTAYFKGKEAARYARPYLNGKRASLEKRDAILHAAGGLYASAADMSRWLAFQLNDGRVDGRQIVPASLIQESREPLADLEKSFGAYQRRHYAYGWYIGSSGERTLVHHFGSFPGARAHISMMPDRKTGVAVMVNSTGAGFVLADIVADYAYRLVEDPALAEKEGTAALADLLARRIKRTARIEAETAKRAARKWHLSAPLTAYAGVYEHPQIGRLEVKPAGETLQFKAGLMSCRAEAFERPEAVRVEMVPGSGSVATFEKGDDGVIAVKLMGTRFERVR